jgi:hypothetical protein
LFMLHQTDNISSLICLAGLRGAPFSFPWNVVRVRSKFWWKRQFPDGRWTTAKHHWIKTLLVLPTFYCRQCDCWHPDQWHYMRETERLTRCHLRVVSRNSAVDQITNDDDFFDTDALSKKKLGSLHVIQSFISNRFDDCYVWSKTLLSGIDRADFQYLPHHRWQFFWWFCFF